MQHLYYFKINVCISVAKLGLEDLGSQQELVLRRNDIQHKQQQTDLSVTHFPAAYE